MYKVLLVDDEKQIIKGITQILNWNELHCSVIGEAYNGKMGIEQALALKPDIIVTDIKMPFIEGLDMIAEIQKKLPYVKFIVLSGFSEFEYAKQGLKLGVKDYVLKPLDELDLEQALKRIVDELNLEKKQRDEISQYKELSAAGRILLQEQLLRDLLNSGENNKDLIEELEEQEIKLKHNYITCMVAHFESHHADWAQKPISIEIKNEYMLIVFRYSHNECAIILNHSWKKGLNYHTTINNLKHSLAHTYKDQMSLGVGSTYNTLRHLGTSFEEAKLANGYFILGNEEHIIYYDDIQNSDSIIKLPETLLNKVLVAVEQLNKDHLSQAIDDIINFLENSSHIKQVNFRKQCLNLYLMTANKMTPIQVQELNHLVSDNLLSIENKTLSWSLDMYKTWMNKFFHTIIQWKKEHQIHKKHDVIEEVLIYIDNHFSENLSLSSIAEHFYITPNYLSQLFRKKTNDTFLGYLTKRRIEKAKKLLLDSDAMIYEVCRQVGYEDLKYFRKIFEKNVGMKPSEFKASAKTEPN